VNIRLLGEWGQWATSVIPYVFAVVKESMRKGGGDGCEPEAVGDGKRCGKEDGAVGLVSLEVERGIGIDDLRDVILFPCVIENV
jgi:hypothetical protein